MINCLPRLLLIAPRLSHCLANSPLVQTVGWNLPETQYTVAQKTLYINQSLFVLFLIADSLVKNYLLFFREKAVIHLSLTFLSFSAFSVSLHFYSFKSATAKITQEITINIYFLLLFMTIQKEKTKVTFFSRTAWLVLEKVQYLNASKIRTSPRRTARKQGEAVV